MYPDAPEGRFGIFQFPLGQLNGQVQGRGACKVYIPEWSWSLDGVYQHQIGIFSTIHRVPNKVVLCQKAWARHCKTPRGPAPRVTLILVERVIILRTSRILYAIEERVHGRSARIDGPTTTVSSILCHVGIRCRCRYRDEMAFPLFRGTQCATPFSFFAPHFACHFPLRFLWLS